MECIHLTFFCADWLILGNGCSKLFLSLFSSSAILLATVVNHHLLGFYSVNFTRNSYKVLF